MLICVKEPTGGGIAFLRMTATKQPPPQQGQQQQQRPPPPQIADVYDDVDADEAELEGKDDDAAFDHLVSQLSAPQVDESTPEGFMEWVVHFWKEFVEWFRRLLSLDGVEMEAEEHVKTE